MDHSVQKQFNQMELPNINVEQILNDAKGEITEKVIAQVKVNITDGIVWSLRDSVSESVKTFIQEEIMPEVQASLVAQKSELLNGVLEGLSQVGAEVSKAMLAQAIKNLEQSWNAKKIADGLFN